LWQEIGVRNLPRGKKKKKKKKEKRGRSRKWKGNDKEETGPNMREKM